MLKRILTVTVFAFSSNSFLLLKILNLDIFSNLTPGVQNNTPAAKLCNLQVYKHCPKLFLLMCAQHIGIFFTHSFLDTALLPADSSTLIPEPPYLACWTMLDHPVLLYDSTQWHLGFKSPLRTGYTNISHPATLGSFPKHRLMFVKQNSLVFIFMGNCVMQWK